MVQLTVFHSGNPAWMSCKKAIVIAESIKEIFDSSVELKIFTTDSSEAQKYNFMSSTNVLVNDEHISLDIALSKDKLKEYIENKIAAI